MAQDLTEVIPQILAQSVDILRENAIMARLVLGKYGTEAQRKGAIIDIPVPSALEARDVVPANVAPNPPSSNDLVPTNVPLPLNSWKEVPFTMSDKELVEVVDGFQPRVLQEAVKALANAIDDSILALYKKVYNVVGTAGTTPFGTSLLEAQQAYRVLQSALAPKGNRSVVLDPFGEANAIGLDKLQSVADSGSDMTLREAMLGRVLGFDWYGDQNIPTHTTTLAAGTLVDNVSGYAAGVSSILIDNGSGALATAPTVGDVFTIGTGTQQYTVTAYTAASTEGTLEFSPPLVASISNNDALNPVASHTVNLAFHRDAFAFASRPLEDLGAGEIQTISDPISGVTMRLELVRQHKRTYFSLDCLWGVVAVRPELAVRIAG